MPPRPNLYWIPSLVTCYCSKQASQRPQADTAQHSQNICNIIQLFLSSVWLLLTGVRYEGGREWLAATQDRLLHALRTVLRTQVLPANSVPLSHASQFGEMFHRAGPPALAAHPKGVLAR